MHALYSFVIDVGETTKGAKGKKLKRIVDTAVQTYEGYADKYCDENNWDDVQYVVTASNAVVSRGDGGTAERIKQRAKTAKLKPFAYVRRFALDCVLADSGIFDVQAINLGAPSSAERAEQARLDKLPFVGLLAEAHTAGAAKIAALYARIGACDPTDPACDPANLVAMIERTSLVGAYEHLLASRRPPFSQDLATPYEYRAYDLSCESGPGRARPMTDQLVILVADIHT